MRRILASHPWTPVPARIEQVPAGGGRLPGMRIVVRLDTSAGPRTMETVGFNRVDPGSEPEAWMAGPSEGRVVLAVPGGGHLVYLRPVRSG